MDTLVAALSRRRPRERSQPLNEQTPLVRQTRRSQAWLRNVRRRERGAIVAMLVGVPLLLAIVVLAHLHHVG